MSPNRDRHIAFCHRFSFFISEFCRQNNAFHRFIVIHNFRTHGDLCDLFIYAFRFYKYAVRRDMCRLSNHKMNIPVDTATGIPASAWHAIFYDHFDGISQLLY